MGIMRIGHSNGRAEPIEISPAPALYLVEFTLGHQPHDRISIILPATCALAAMTGAWELFPEYHRDALRTFVHHVSYVEINWKSGRTIIVKKKPEAHIPVFKVKESNKRKGKKKKNDVESSE